MEKSGNGRRRSGQYQDVDGNRPAERLWSRAYRKGDDPLHLAKYVDHYDTLLRDLNDFDKTDTTFAFAALKVRDADRFFIDKDSTPGTEYPTMWRMLYGSPITRWVRKRCRGTLTRELPGPDARRSNLISIRMAMAVSSTLIILRRFERRSGKACSATIEGGLSIHRASTQADCQPDTGCPKGSDNKKYGPSQQDCMEAAIVADTSAEPERKNN